jgi:hypothetical protein
MKTMQTQTIAEAKDLVSFAQQTLEALGSAGQRLAMVPEFSEELSWLACAARRVLRGVEAVDRALQGATALPEFEAEQKARGAALFEDWVNAAEGLLVGICSNVSANSPLIEILFPHQKFDKLRRGGAAARTFMLELERRRRTAYIVRVSAEPEYSFMPPLLERLDAARVALEVHEEPNPLTPEKLAELRATVLQPADDLRVTLQQARLLAEAALTAQPGLFAELGLDAKPKKRAVRSSAAPSAEPAEA